MIRRTTLPAVERDVVHLTFSARSGTRTFAVTSDHRVCVETKYGERQSVEAAQLLTRQDAAPWLVVTGAGATLVLEAKLFKRRTEVVEVVFEADAEVLVWMPWRMRGRSLSLSAGVMCRGSPAEMTDVQAAAGACIRRGFFDATRSAVHKRGLSAGDVPWSPLWYSRGSVGHRRHQRSMCRVCIQHKRFSKGESDSPCPHGEDCWRCHMPH